MGVMVPDLIKAVLRQTKIGDVRGLSTPRPLQKATRAADVFLMMNSGYVNESVRKQKVSHHCGTHWRKCDASLIAKCFKML